MEYLFHILIIISLYSILAQSLNLTAGYSGLISLAHAGFYGLGAYCTALLSVHFNLSFLITLPISVFFTGIIAYLISVIALRTVDDYFIIVTLGIQVIVLAGINNLISLTSGPLGISGIPDISFFGIVLKSKISYLLIALIFSILVFIVLRQIIKSPYGRLLISASNDEIFTQSLGKNVKTLKITSFTLGAAIASIAGVLYAHYISYINPSSFTLDESIFILSIVIIGGLRSMWGNVVSCIVLISFPEILMLFGVSDSITANVHQIFYGTLLIIVVFLNQYFRPKNQIV